MTLDPALLRHRRLLLRGRFVDPVVIEEAFVDGDLAELRVRTAHGRLVEEVIPIEELQAALADDSVASAPALVSAEHQWLLVEGRRIRLAYAFDPFFAVSLSSIDPLPHQLEAVYQHMLPQPRLRFLLADDPGAGKTIMAGLLLKELELRGVVERVLIVSPAPLTFQWQEELKTKFDTVFERIEATAAKDQLAGSPWQRFSHCVTSMDFAKRPEIRGELLSARWDMVIIDEAHKVACADLDHQTDRFRLARELAQRTERLLLLTATPHQGNQEQFRNLLSLLDEDVFRDPEQARQVVTRPDSPWLLRRAKEQLHGFDGRQLFVDRHASTEDFALSAIEYELYQEVGQYIVRFLPKQQGRKKASAQLARTVLQRRVASSLYAIRRSLERRRDRLHRLLEEVEAAPPHQRMELLSKRLNLQVPDPEEQDEDEQEELFDAAATETFVAERWEQLLEERVALETLLALAVAAKASGRESKLQKLFECLDRIDFASLETAKARLLIFTEHKDTLDYLKCELEARGLSCTVIHGGMNAVDRRQAQRDFRENKQVLIATDAAGEGINLQFCHLLINYDLPWNPVRLEQRMGRIHRYGQDTDVHVYNFVAVSGPNGISEPVIEGRVLQTLLNKLTVIRRNLGDRVFDVVGMLLRLNGIDLEEILRDAVFSPRTLADYTDTIERLSDDELRRHEEATGIALATRHVNLQQVRGQQWDHDERRLMPEYVESWFLQAAKAVGQDVVRRAAQKDLFRVEHVKQKFRDRGLESVRRHGSPQTEYAKLSFVKAALKGEHQDGQLLSPIHPLYASVEEVLGRELAAARGACAVWQDPRDAEPYRLHVYEVEVEGESQGDPGQPPRPVPVHTELVAVQERNGAFVRMGPDLLLDLLHGDEQDLSARGAGVEPPTPEELVHVQRWLRRDVQLGLINEQRQARQREVDIRGTYLNEAFAASISKKQQARMKALARMARDPAARITLEKAQQELADLEVVRDRRLEALRYLEVVRAGRVMHLASAVVVPTVRPDAQVEVQDPAVELAAVEVAKAYETARGRVVAEVWRRHDGCGFDLRSVGPADADGNREVRRIEVKGRGPATGHVVLTPNERRHAERLGDSYWLYVVWSAKGPNPRLKCIRDPVRTLGDALVEVAEIKYHRASAEALEAAVGEGVVGVTV
jgi:superfamily II DNA or RNA helicase